MKELRGKIGVLVGLDLPSAGEGTETGVQSPEWGNCLSQRRKVIANIKSTLRSREGENKTAEK